MAKKIQQNKQKIFPLIIRILTALAFLGFGLWYWIPLLSTGSNVLVDSTVCGADAGWFRFAFLNCAIQALSAFVASYGIMNAIILLLDWLLGLLSRKNFLNKTIKVVFGIILFAISAFVIYLFINMWLTEDMGGFVIFLIVLVGIVAGILATLPILYFAVKHNYNKTILMIKVLTVGVFVVFLLLGTAMWLLAVLPFLGFIFFLLPLAALIGCGYEEFYIIKNGNLFILRIWRY
ncbi:MAG: hypothetical protein E7353_04970 [Clostridiales bacterium]|nr:hypothetical protein [Clostridiales bacterium]